MRLIPTTALAALTAGGLSLAALPDAYAQDVEYSHFRHGSAEHHWQPGPGMMRPGDGAGMMSPGGAQLLAFICSPQAATRAEQALSNLADRLQLSEPQTPLFEEFRTQTLTAQSAYAEKCAALIEHRPDDLIEAIKTRQALLSARLDAVESVLPSFEALYGALTDTQKFELVRGRAGHFGAMRGGEGWQRGDDRRPGKDDGPAPAMPN